LVLPDDCEIECAASGAVRYINRTTSTAFITTTGVRKKMPTPVTIISSPKEVAFVVACSLVSVSLKRNKPMEAISIKTDPRNTSKREMISFIFSV